MGGKGRNDGASGSAILRYETGILRHQALPPQHFHSLEHNEKRNSNTATPPITKPMAAKPSMVDLLGLSTGMDKQKSMYLDTDDLVSIPSPNARYVPGAFLGVSVFRLSSRASIFFPMSCPKPLGFTGNLKKRSCALLRQLCLAHRSQCLLQDDNTILQRTGICRKMHICQQVFQGRRSCQFVCSGQRAALQPLQNPLELSVTVTHIKNNYGKLTAYTAKYKSTDKTAAFFLT